MLVRIFTGVFILNCLCRSQSLKESVLADLKSIFPSVLAKRIQEDVNEVIFALPEGQEGRLDLGAEGAPPKELQTALKVMSEVEKVQHPQGEDKNNLCNALTGLKIV